MAMSSHVRLLQLVSSHAEADVDAALWQLSKSAQLFTRNRLQSHCSDAAVAVAVAVAAECQLQ